MAIFKTPRATTAQRTGLTLEVGEIVYDTDQKTFYGGNGTSLGGFLIGGNSGFIYRRIELTSQNIQDKYITLPDTPLSPTSVFLTIEGGIPQINGVDYEIIGDKISWDGLGLDNFLDNTDVLLVLY